MEMEARLERIESKLAFAEDLLDTLNETVYRQQEVIERLQQQLRVMALQLQAASAGAAESGDLRDEIPPHY